MNRKEFGELVAKDFKRSGLGRNNTITVKQKEEYLKQKGYRLYLARSITELKKGRIGRTYRTEDNWQAFKVHAALTYMAVTVIKQGLIPFDRLVRGYGYGKKAIEINKERYLLHRRSDFLVMKNDDYKWCTWQRGFLIRTILDTMNITGVDHYDFIFMMFYTLRWNEHYSYGHKYYLESLNQI